MTRGSVFEGATPSSFCASGQVSRRNMQRLYTLCMLLSFAYIHLNIRDGSFSGTISHENK